ncbi:MAG TPA: MBOAT family protein, partial [Polyangiaceae bacterium]
MIFTELRFFAFLALVLAAYWALRGLQSRKVLLLVASYVFYGAWDYRFLGLLLLSTTVDYSLGVVLA